MFFLSDFEMSFFMFAWILASAFSIIILASLLVLASGFLITIHLVSVVFFLTIDALSETEKQVTLEGRCDSRPIFRE